MIQQQFHQQQQADNSSDVQFAQFTQEGVLFLGILNCTVNSASATLGATFVA